MQHEFAVSGRWREEFSEEKLRSWASQLRGRLQAPRVSLGFVFLTPEYFANAARILEILRVHAQIPVLIGCSSATLIEGSEELEEEPGLVLSLLAMPGAELRPVRFTQEQVVQCKTSAAWHAATGIEPARVNGWIALADPFSLDPEALLRSWNEAYPGKPVQGGMAGGAPSSQSVQLYLDGEVFGDGGVALAVGGGVELVGLVSQGCTPIGETWTVTKVEKNFVHEIASRPAYEVLAETFNGLSEEEQTRARGNLFIGLVVNEYLEDFHRGDFLVRNILGGDPRSGSLAVGAFPRVGQTLQFQRRDGAAASEDLSALLRRLATKLAGRPVYGGCLFNCNGRGRHLFGHPHHDAALVRKKLEGIELTGIYCNGEMGPVGERNFLHSYTASLALFASKVPNGLIH